MISVKAPGKLYIAGEYAVVETGLPAIIVALNQFVKVSVSKAEKFGSIVSKQYQENSIYWTRENDRMVFDDRDNPFHYILSAIKITEEYAKKLNKPLGLYHLKINSELDSADGKKYGLGSSAAVTVATINALCQFYKLPIDKDKLFKLAAIAHFEIQGNGSLGDIAASVYGGWIAYHSFDRDWLKLARKNYDLPKLLSEKWPSLNIEILTPPENMKLMIGWTGSPASTSHLVDKVALAKAKEGMDYQQFLNDSKNCLQSMIEGFKKGSLAVITKQLSENRRILDNLSKLSGVAIETANLKKLCDIAVNHGGAAKSSGAGGGDCGIVLIDKAKQTEKLVEEWVQNQIEPLNFNVHTLS
ncbi:phosphomevalonate kinase [Secundilactobacillus malefermentans]|uniref:phosphomevalonate kinase n=1 Tax=Secundilactobacillus malefermentans TaxID=176292 RepID=UPI0011CA357E|nr:phosphomevalonate kinase [Secundilactobacillus malefermentans]QEA32404.1 phosphomevalonate kinase [Secundilactobacillus malefermentans]